jgi:hypothetical protein
MRLLLIVLRELNQWVEWRYESLVYYSILKSGSLQQLLLIFNNKLLALLGEVSVIEYMEVPNTYLLANSLEILIELTEYLQLA